MKSENISTGAAIAIILLAITMVYGWFVNLYQLVMGCIDFSVTSNWALLMLRGLGVVVAPLGGILGLFV